ncbi:MAG: hypothetical protein E7348_02330 [Clostridiales bacterium]|nr:hypothetical protein [Clostridiales bacterium]
MKKTDELYFSQDIVKKDEQRNSKLKLWFARFSLKIKYSKLFGYSTILSFVSLIITVVVNVLSFDGKKDIGVYVRQELLPGIIISLLPLVLSLIKEFVETFKSYRSSYVVKDDRIKDYIKQNLVSSKDYQKSGYSWQEYNGESYEMSRDVNNMLAKMDSENQVIKMDIIKRKFPVPEEVTKIFDYKIKQRIEDDKIIFNGKLVRLSTDLSTQKGFKKVKLERTDYFSNVITNDSIYETCRNRLDVDYLLNGYKFCIKDKIDDDKVKQVSLLDLCDNYCANIIGISTLVLTSDNKVITLRQGNGDVNRDKYVPTGSGSAEYCELKKFTNFFDFLKHEMHREMLEELQISKANYKALNCSEYYITKYKAQTHIIGYCRLLERGGKPDFFGLTYLPNVSSRLLQDYFNVYKSRISYRDNKLKQKRKDFGKHEIGDFIILNNLRELEDEKYKNKVSLQLEIIKNLVYEIAKDNTHPLNTLANKYLTNN